MAALNLNKENRFALAVAGFSHLVLLLFFIFYTITVRETVRPSFIEVEFGEYQTGAPAEFSEETNPEVATRPDPSEIQPENPQPEQMVQREEQQAAAEETVKPVDAPDQQEEIVEEVIETPETDKVDPEEPENAQEQEEVIVPPKMEEDETRKEGAESSGDEKGNEGRIDADQGSGNDAEKTAPYELKWDGDLDRSPMVQPLPENDTGIEATITIRFEVKPNGTLGRIIPLRKMNPELEREVMRTLRAWRFSRLPSGVPQESQWGTITFRFVLD